MSVGIFLFGLLAVISIINMFKALNESLGCGCLAFVITVLAVMVLLLARIL